MRVMRVMRDMRVIFFFATFPIDQYFYKMKGNQSFWAGGWIEADKAKHPNGQMAVERRWWDFLCRFSPGDWIKVDHRLFNRKSGKRNNSFPST